MFLWYVRSEFHLGMSEQFSVTALATSPAPSQCGRSWVWVRGEDSCISSLLLCSKLPHNSSAWNNEHLFSHTVSKGQESGLSLAGCLQFGLSHEVTVKVLTGAVVDLRVDWGREIPCWFGCWMVIAPGPPLFAGCWQESPVPRHEVLSIELFARYYDTAARSFQSEQSAPEKGFHSWQHRTKRKLWCLFWRGVGKHRPVTSLGESGHRCNTQEEQTLAPPFEGRSVKESVDIF